MSCGRWLEQNGDRPWKKIPVSDKSWLPKTVAPAAPVAPGSSSSGEEDDFFGRRQDEIWTSIQRDKMKRGGGEQGQSDIWSSIISQKDGGLTTSKSVPSPYLHPLVKRSQSSLSEKSLEICTESLGSETGWNGFSEDQEKEEDRNHHQQVCDSAEEDFRMVGRYHHAAATEKLPPRPFPPPLPSLSQDDGASLRMRTVVEDGRLVVEAVSVPSKKHFHAERQDGRLLLTFVHGEEQEKGDGDEREFENADLNDMDEEPARSDDIYDEDEDGEDETKGIEIVIQDRIRNMSVPGVMNLHRLLLRPSVLNGNIPWPAKIDEVVELKETAETEEEEVEEEEKVAMKLMTTTRLLPSATAPAVSAMAVSSDSLRPYEYYWNPKPTSRTETQIFDQFIQQEASSHLCNSGKKFLVTKNIPPQNDRPQLMVLRGRNGAYLVPMARTCKESRTSVLYWQPYNCIAS